VLGVVYCEDHGECSSDEQYDDAGSMQLIVTSDRCASGDVLICFKSPSVVDGGWNTSTPAQETDMWRAVYFEEHSGCSVDELCYDTGTVQFIDASDRCAPGDVRICVTKFAECGLVRKYDRLLVREALLRHGQYASGFSSDSEGVCVSMLDGGWNATPQHQKQMCWERFIVRPTANACSMSGAMTQTPCNLSAHLIGALLEISAFA
jgi:hypothetical protein